MTGRNKKRSFDTSYDFTLSEDTVYSPFDGVFSVPFVIPEEDTNEEEAEEAVRTKKPHIKSFLQSGISVAALILVFIPSLKSNITAIEFVYAEDNSIYVQGLQLEEIVYGTDALKAVSLEEERAYVKATRLLKKAKPAAVKVSKTVSAKPKKKAFIWPAKGAAAISSPYGYRNPEISGRSFHGGIDIVTGKGNSTGTPVVAAASGTVIHVAESYRGYGHQVLIDHGKGVTTRYAHMLPNSISVCTGEKINQGQQLGKIGSTGNTTGPHLHFEVMVDGVKVNPMSFLSSRQKG